ncbi:LAQU0S01e11298g1_1 [Lachancea quebecensis]|uniref:LAQU0S01e11298g1_1 n=1 Tax=Lachancea quebecensis TaxID=1654605 RepID=A0A0P1KL67_9SACH|nr:LAQU0S01e11298g1_1 [Lachancea quebecensis]
MQVILLDKNKALVSLWKKGLESFKYVSFHTGTLEDLPREMLGTNAAVVSPGNSFGFLGGGFDLAIQSFFGGKDFEKFFKKQIGQFYKPVGEATIVDLDHWARNGIRYIVHIPTVVAPTRKIFDAERPIETGYQLVFNAMWSALVHTPKEVESLIVPGLGTGYLGVPEAVCSKSMVFALKMFSAGKIMSVELRNVLIMHFLGFRYEGFFPATYKEECAKLGIDLDKLKHFDVCEHPVTNLLPNGHLSI